MQNIQKMGGWGSLVNSAAYLIGIIIAFTIVKPVLDADPQEYVEFLVDNHTALYVWHFILYILAGVFMVPMVLGVHDRLKDGNLALAQIATGFGLIWAGLVIASGLLILTDMNLIIDLYDRDPVQAIATYETLASVEDALGGAIELPGGLWVFLLSIVALGAGEFPKALNYLGMIIGVAGILTLIPALADFGAIFGIGFIIWFAWAGLDLLRNSN